MEDLRLDPTSLFTPCPTGSLGFETTEELPELEEIVGQDRALEAIRFGIGIRSKGFNLYALGPSGRGRTRPGHGRAGRACWALPSGENYW